MNQGNIADDLSKQKLLFDGAFGTYYAQVYDTKDMPEVANIKSPDRVIRIHREYVEAGAQIIRTNTFASNTISLDVPWEEVCENIRQGYRLAQSVAEEAQNHRQVYVAADIGQMPMENLYDREEASQEYVAICRTFLEEGARLFVFETFSDIEEIREAIDVIGEQAFIIVQYCVNQFGYSNTGLSARKLVQQAEENKYVDAVGFNCGVGPGHMRQIMERISLSGTKYFSVLPNAGYPQMVSKRMIFKSTNCEYFVEKIQEMANAGADLIGGCCGTTPEYIRALKESVSLTPTKKIIETEQVKKARKMKTDSSFFAGKEGKKLIAVELVPPLGSDDEVLMDAAHLLRKSGADVLTFPDSPSGRTRADSVLMAEKVAKETGMCVMPHLCCRDKNAIAMRSQVLGAYINKIQNFLVITGDPIPTLARGDVKSVFNFDSVGLMRLINDMNEEQFMETPVCYGGAINQGRKNLDIEITRVKKKMEAGATFFFTQPICTRESVERVRQIKEATGVRILCGVMPFVSLRNATFMKNEMTGIGVTEEVLARYRADMTREEGEAAGVELAREMMALADDFSDGYYFSFPFNRVYMLEKILTQ